MTVAVVQDTSSSNPLPQGWTLTQRGDPFSGRAEADVDDSGRPTPVWFLSFPPNTVSEPGWHVTVGTVVDLPSHGDASLTFNVEDTFSGPTQGYHVFIATVNGHEILSEDVADLEGIKAVSINLRDLEIGPHLDLCLSLTERKAVSNFPITVQISRLRITTEDGTRDLLPIPTLELYSDLPEDLPLPSLPMVGEEWTRSACILQPWGETQWEAVTHADERADPLAKNFGFNTVILLPPKAHNAITGPQHHITEEEFIHALKAFRRAGFRFILYSSIMHCGHDPSWQEGHLERAHPEWAQKGPLGETVRNYGHDWLCPSTDALKYTINYTMDLVKRYDADAVMLDNNEFYRVPSGLTCYCASCQAKFADYVRKRFGEVAFGQPTAKIKIPTDPGPLFNLWLHWRNRVWAEANESYRKALAETRPGTVLLSNTQYLYPDGALATDLQYEHEDAMLSESRTQDLHGMVSKLLLGKTLSAGRPLWNYLGTFRENDFTKLRGADEVAMNVSTAFALGARPWVVYYGFEGTGQATEAEAAMAARLRWHLEKEKELGELKPYRPVVSLISHRSRNNKGGTLIPETLSGLRSAGIPVWLMEERHAEEEELEDVRALLIEDAPCLSRNAAKRIAHWVRSGGHLWATARAGAFDEVGQILSRSCLMEELGLERLKREGTPLGQGLVHDLRALTASEELPKLLTTHAFNLSPPIEAEILPYTDPGGQLLLYLCSQAPLPKTFTVTPPLGLRGHAILCCEKMSPVTLPLP